MQTAPPPPKKKTVITSQVLEVSPQTVLISSVGRASLIACYMSVGLHVVGFGPGTDVSHSDCHVICKLNSKQKPSTRGVNSTTLNR